MGKKKRDWLGAPIPEPPGGDQPLGMDIQGRDRFFRYVGKKAGRPRRKRRPRDERGRFLPRHPSRDPISEDNFLAVYGRYRVSYPKLNEKNLAKDFGGNALGANSLLGKFKTYTNGKVTQTVNQFVGGTLTLSQSMKQTWDQKNPGPPYVTGGCFFSADALYANSGSVGRVGLSNLGAPGVTSDNKSTYEGILIDNGNWGSDTISNYRTGKPAPVVLNSYHTLAWDQLKPHIEKANVAQFIYELKDVPGMLRTTARGFASAWERDSTLVRSTIGSKFNRAVEFMAPREAADHFVNYQFGWAPFVRDLQSMITTYYNSRELLIQAVRDNGRWKKVRKVLDITETNTRLNRFYGAATLPGSGNFRFDNLCEPRIIDGISCTGITELWLRQKTTTWAAGSFRFYRPEFDDSLIGFESEIQNIQRLLTLYGVRINPTVLWKITPWTWLVDWFVSLGGFIQRWDDYINDGIVAKYLYVMQESIRAVTKSGSAFCRSGVVNFQWQRNLTTKRRECASSPYGFNTPWRDISANQWAILGSIGLTRSSIGRRGPAGQ